MSIAPGTQIRSPLGYGSLEKMGVYHVIYTDEEVHQRVILAHFTVKPRKSHLAYISIAKYEDGRKAGLIKVLQGNEGARFPPWLADRADEIFDYDEEKKKSEDRAKENEKESLEKPQISDYDVVKDREGKMQSAVFEFEKIFTQLHPEKALKRIARSLGANEQRYVRDAIAYFAFDKKADVLRPPKNGRGIYDRKKVSSSGKRSGRPSRKGPGYGYDVTEDMKKLMKKGWRRFARLKRQLKVVYTKTLVHVFGCRYEATGDRTKIIHPKGNPFPSYGEFRYWILQFYTHEGVWGKLLGDIEYRKRFPKNKGSYHEGVRDLLEKVYSDATTFDQIPRSLIGGMSLPLIEVSEVDPLIGVAVGVSWGVGGETASLYNQARAFLALPKSLIGEVLGLKIKDEDFPLSGLLPSTGQTDNGAGASKKIGEINKRFGVSTDRTPVYNPQTNAPVERSHAPSMQLAGIPHYEVSKLTGVEMAKQSFLRILKELRSKDISNRLTPEVAALGIKTPLEYLRYLLSQGRIQGRPISVHEAITSLLPEVTYEIRDGQLTRHGVAYRSDDFTATEFAQQIWRHDGEELKGHAFDISNRVEWVKVNKRLVKVYAVPPVQEHASHYVMGAHELKAYEKAILEARSTAKEQNQAESVRLELDSIEATGQSYMASTLKRGRAPSRSSRRAPGNNYPV